VKRNGFIKELVSKGCYMRRHGMKHDIYVNPKNSRKAPVLRHREIRNSLCKLIKETTRNKIKGGIYEKII